ncbi:hypothetical protein KKC45_02720, partial [Patescibacteria group bacterium]|nr:hypothetical protein [Patescibacteria group bacterium]
MENIRVINKIILIFLLGIFLITPAVSYAYGVSAHQDLTYKTFRSYGELFGEKFDSKEVAKAIQGSSDEDDGNRPLRHFYDPINNIGLTIVKSWMSSKEWAQNTEAQAEYGKNPTYTEKYFENPDDYSWDRAIFEYTYGDRERAFESLGHVLHLIQDTTVPAHVRNDEHLNGWGIEDINLYEEFTKNINVPEIKIKFEEVPNFLSLGEAFDFSSEFTNENFLSKDTVFEDYKNPSRDNLSLKKEIIKNKSLYFGYNNNFDFKVVSIKRDYNKDDEKIIEQYSLSSLGDLVLKDYWNVLSKESIKNGVGVIDLFFREVEAEKNTGILLAKNKSKADLVLEKTRPASFDFVKNLYGSSLDSGEVAELLGEKQTATAIGSGGSTSGIQVGNENEGGEVGNIGGVDNSGENPVDRVGESLVLKGDNSETDSQEGEGLTQDYGLNEVDSDNSENGFFVNLSQNTETPNNDYGPSFQAPSSYPGAGFGGGGESALLEETSDGLGES